MIDPVLPTQPMTPKQPERREDLWHLSVAFEATFLNEMLKSSGVNTTSSSFGGGAGEDAFSSLLTQTYADGFSKAGGIGLAQHVYSSMLEREAKS